MKTVSTTEAVEILLCHGYSSYQEHGLGKMVQFQEVAEIEGIEEQSIINGFNHLHALGAIQADASGGFSLEPRIVESINKGQEVAGISSVVIINSEVTMGDHSPIIKSDGNINIRQEIVEEINRRVPDDQKPLWNKIKDGPLLDILVTTAKKVITESF